MGESPQLVEPFWGEARVDTLPDEQKLLHDDDKDARGGDHQDVHGGLGARVFPTQLRRHHGDASGDG